MSEEDTNFQKPLSHKKSSSNSSTSSHTSNSSNSSHSSHTTYSSSSDSPNSLNSFSLYSPLNWTNYFDEEKFIEIPSTGDIFHLYSCNPPLKDGIVFLCLHGASHSALSWATTAKEIKALKSGGVLAIDFRGHGQTKTKDDTDLSVNTLVNDIGHVLNLFFNSVIPQIVIVGHSMGGGIAVKVARLSILKEKIKAICLIEASEGAAVRSLKVTKTFFDNRPQSFTSLEEAIKWSNQAGVVRNIESARVSVPSQLIHDSSSNYYIWRTNMSLSEPYWLSWFQGLSTSFLSLSCPKMLIFANQDRLDINLITGQMQGKFLLHIFSDCSHTIQEDQPLKTAIALTEFSQKCFF
eukprot:c18664_g1_i2.p1 GENE.c18664_g1_i2~~c18664_g1_i2.p1  ORF type:complete len:350 (-),score=119.19 c18664_g1_i2:28-1077(-)